MNINQSNLSKYIIKLSKNRLVILDRENPEQENISIDPNLDLGKDRYFNEDRASIFKSIIEINFEDIIKFLENKKIINEIQNTENIQQTNPPHSFEYSNSTYIIKSTTLNQDGQKKKLTLEYIDLENINKYSAQITIENDYNSQEHDLRIDFHDDTCTLDISKDSYCYLKIQSGDSFNHHIDIVKTPEGETYIYFRELIVSEEEETELESDGMENEDKFDEILSVPIILPPSLQCVQTGYAAIYDMFKIELDSCEEVHKNLSQYLQSNQN